MKRFTLGAFAMALAVMVTGCGGDTHESLMNEQAKVMNEMADALDKVKSKDDVAKVKGDLESLGKKLKDLEERGKKLGEPKADDLMKLLPKAGEVMKAAGRLMAAQTKAEAAAGAEALKGILPTMPKPPGGGGGIEIPKLP